MFVFSFLLENSNNGMVSGTDWLRHNVIRAHLSLSLGILPSEGWLYLIFNAPNGSEMALVDFKSLYRSLQKLNKETSLFLFQEC